MKYIVTVLLTAACIFVWVPLCLIVFGSLMGKVELWEYLAPVLNGGSGLASFYIFPKYPTLRSFVELLLDTPKFFVMFWNSWKLVLPVLAGQLIIAVPAAWGFAKFSFRFREPLFLLYIVLMLMPFQVTMVSYYLVLDKLHLLDTRWAIILPGAFSTFPVFILYRFFAQTDDSVLEAADIDGAGHLGKFFYIGIPLAKPGIISVLILNFLEYWTMLEQPLAFLQNKSLWPLSLYLPKIVVDKAGVALVASVIMMLPALLCFFYGQSYLQEGINATAYK